MTYFNKLTPAQGERLFLLNEELAEAQQAISKILRHGYESYNPFDPECRSNRRHLEWEIGHIMTALDLLFKAGDISTETVDGSRKNKHIFVHQYLHHQDDSK